MQKENNRAIVLLNMGGARDKNELKMFLMNMFNDENILTIKNTFIRKLIAFFIVKGRLEKAWSNYEKIGCSSPINPLTQKLVDKCNKEIEDFKTYQVMRYTPPFAKETIEQMKKDGIKEVILFPLYPQYSTTTTKSSCDDFIKEAKDEFEIKIIEPFYENSKFNDCIIDEILKNIDDESSYNLIFSAHGLPQKIIDSGDVYEKHLHKHLKILSQKLLDMGKFFKSINLAYQSKLGPLKWLEPSLETTLQNFKDEKVIVYPISFIIDNSETVFELDIEYRHVAKEIGIKEFLVCKCLNDKFFDIVIDIVK